MLNTLLLPACRLPKRRYKTKSCTVSNIFANRRHHCTHACHVVMRQVGAVHITCTASLSATQAQEQFEQWHADKWLSPRRVLHKAGAEMLPVLLPFWLFEAAIKVEYAAQVAVRKYCLYVFVLSFAQAKEG